MNQPPRILVAGIGNIFLGDDAFGCLVVQAFVRRPMRAGVHVTDFGIRGLDLAYTLMENWDAAILIDACPRGDAPGTLYVIEPEIPEKSEEDPALMQGHSMDPVQVLQMVHHLRGKLPRVFLVGCEPSQLDPSEDFNLQMTAPVAAAIEPAAARVAALIDEILDNQILNEVQNDHPDIAPNA